MFSTLLLLCGFIIIIVYYTLQYAKFVRQINNIPGIPGLSVLGITDTYFASEENLWKLIRVAGRCFYPIYRIWLGPFALVGACIYHPDDLEKILSNPTEHLSKGFAYTLFQSWLGTGLLTSEGTKWHKRRKILTPAFHFNILKQFVEILIEEGNRMTKSLKERNGLIVDDLVHFNSYHTLNAICDVFEETAMGTSLQEMDEFKMQYHKAVHEMGKTFVYRLSRPWLFPNMIFSLTSKGKQHKKNLRILHAFTKKIIAERKQYHENSGRYLKYFEDDIETDDIELIGIKKKRLALLDLLILANRDNKMSDEGIREEVDTFMFEGHDTVAMGLTFAILLLAEHKEVQERVRNEVSAVIQANGGKLTMSALNNMPYLERCLKESLRLYPSVPLISRVLSKDVKLQSYVVPSGTTLVINIVDIHRDPNFWPNPDVFDPDRFLPERMQNRHPFFYLPFSAGPRNCIAVIASMVYNFYLEPVDHLKDLQFKMDIISRVAHPIRTRFVPINHMPSDLDTVI